MTVGQLKIRLIDVPDNAEVVVQYELIGRYMESIAENGAHRADYDEELGKLIIA